MKLLPSIEATTARVNLSSLLLILSGDIELNPGPATPKEILQQYSDKLAKACSANVSNIASALYAKDLIQSGTREYVMTTVGVSNSDKADRLITDIMLELESSPNEIQYLHNVCNVLSKQGGSLKQIATLMQQELGGGGADGAISGGTETSTPYYQPQTNGKSIGFKLTMAPRQQDYANCAGPYYESESGVRLRGRPVYYNKERDRLIFFDGTNYVITAYKYWDVIFNDGGTGGFYSSCNTGQTPETSSWLPKYHISPL